MANTLIVMQPLITGFILDDTWDSRKLLLLESLKDQQIPLLVSSAVMQSLWDALLFVPGPDLSGMLDQGRSVKINTLVGAC